MQRIKMEGGVVNAVHWRTLARLCSRYTPDTPLSLITRQDIEFHNVPTAMLLALQHHLADAGFSGQGSCGDTLRAITICPGNGLCAGTPDVGDIARTVRTTLEAFPGIYALPRKFKISFSSCGRACGQPWIHDLGFVAVPESDALAFRVVGAGSLGARPATGIELCRVLPAEHVPAFALGAVRLFHEQGDRSSRSKARLRHVRERLGDDSFRVLLQDCVQQSVSLQRPVHIARPPISAQYHRVAVLAPPGGLVTPEQASALAGLIERTGCVVRLDTHHRIVVYTRQSDETSAALSAEPLLSGLASPVDIASCPGTTWCRHAIVNTRTPELLLRHHLSGRGISAAVRISGCPNGCAHSGVAHIGLVGRVRKADAVGPVEGFQVLRGGGMGMTPALAQSIADFVPSEQLPGFFDTMPVPGPVAL